MFFLSTIFIINYILHLSFLILGAEGEEDTAEGEEESTEAPRDEL